MALLGQIAGKVLATWVNGKRADGRIETVTALSRITSWPVAEGFEPSMTDVITYMLDRMCTCLQMQRSHR